MKICQIMSLPIPPEDGMGNYVYNLSRRLVKKGHEVTIITRGNDPRTEKSYYDEISVYKAPFKPLYPLHVQYHGIFVKRLLGKIGDDFDIVNYHTPLPPAIKTKAPIVTTVHGTNERFKTDSFPLTTVLQSKFNYFTDRKLFRLSSRIITVSSSIEKEMKTSGLDGRRIDVIGNGVDEMKFKPSGRIPADKYLLYVGRLSYRKGIYDFIDAGFKICEKYPDVRITIAGKGPLLPGVRDKVNNSVHRDRFDIPGYVDDRALVGLYQNATLFVIPSYYEGLPTSLIEAMACGLPVVATEIAGNVDLVDPGKNGILVPARSVDGIVNAISELLEDEGKRKRLGAMARKTIEGKFTWDKISDEYIRCYQEVLAGK